MIKKIAALALITAFSTGSASVEVQVTAPNKHLICDMSYLQYSGQDDSVLRCKSIVLDKIFSDGFGY